MSTYPVLVIGLHPQSPGRSPLVFISLSCASDQGSTGGDSGAGSGPR